MKKTDIKSPLLLFLAAFIWGVLLWPRVRLRIILWSRLLLMRYEMSSEA